MTKSGKNGLLSLFQKKFHKKFQKKFKHQVTTLNLSIFIGLLAVIIGLIAFTLSWNLWDLWGGPLPGYKVFLFPGNLTLIYIWHPLFTEEVNFWPKLGLLMLGQFFVVTCFSAIVIYLIKKWFKP